MVLRQLCQLQPLVLVVAQEVEALVVVWILIQSSPSLKEVAHAQRHNKDLIDRDPVLEDGFVDS
jgi:hypothetical protein